MNRRRRKIITRVIVFLLLGAIVNVAVAWGCAAIFDPFLRMTDHQYTVDEDDKQFALEDGQSLPSMVVYEGHAFGSRVAIVRGTAAMHPPFGHYPHISSVIPYWATRKDLNPFFLHVLDGRGFPFTTMTSELETPQIANYKFEVHNGIQSGLAPRDMGWMKIPRVLPLRPIWPGFAINTIFYAAILWLLFFAPGSVRRTIRRRRGLCPACAYPVGTSPVCTECGKAVQPKGTNLA